jgi:hypothetical protein
MAFNMEVVWVLGLVRHDIEDKVDELCNLGVGALGPLVAGVRMGKFEDFTQNFQYEDVVYLIFALKQGRFEDFKYEHFNKIPISKYGKLLI